MWSDNFTHDNTFISWLFLSGPFLASNTHPSSFGCKPTWRKTEVPTSWSQWEQIICKRCSLKSEDPPLHGFTKKQENPKPSLLNQWLLAKLNSICKTLSDPALKEDYHLIESGISINRVKQNLGLWGTQEAQTTVRAVHLPSRKFHIGIKSSPSRGGC